MDVIYCVKCRQPTKTINGTVIVSKNNRKMLQGICENCGCKKSQFIKNNVGAGIFNKALTTVGNLIGEMHLPARAGENVMNGAFNNLNKYSYCGPGTKYSQRVQEGYKGINELDRMCKLHDQFYNEYADTASRNISDEALAHRAHEISSNPQYDSSQRKMATLVYYIMKNKARFGLGLSKN